MSTTVLMRTAALRLLSAMTPAQRAMAVMPFESNDRLDWHFTPRGRRGVAFKELDPAARLLAHALLSAGLSPKGAMKAASIMALEKTLGIIEGGHGFLRDPELYYVSVFGEPSATSTWGWRVEGHHVSLHMTIVDGVRLVGAPSFFGSNPAEVRQGDLLGMRLLAGEEDLARRLLHSMNAEQRETAIIDAIAPRDILSYNRPAIEPDAPRGLPMNRFTMPQVDLLMALLDEYITPLPDEIAEYRRGQFRRFDWSEITFAWAGGLERGEGHYYRVQSPAFLVEYDNTQNDANHIHAVWRDFTGDFGRDLLREHLRQEHQQAAVAGEV